MLCAQYLILASPHTHTMPAGVWGPKLTIKGPQPPRKPCGQAKAKKTPNWSKLSLSLSLLLLTAHHCLPSEIRLSAV